MKLCDLTLSACASGATPTSPTRDILVTFHAGGAPVSTYFLADVLGFFAPAPLTGLVTSVTASAPLGSSGGATPNISLVGTIPVASGGTGAATVAAGPFVAKTVGSCPAGQVATGFTGAGAIVCASPATFGGDGSAGDLTVSSPANWNMAPPANPNFGNITINAGQTLAVPAGTTIRCSGTFTNNGTLLVTQGAFAAALDNFAFFATVDIYSTGHPGDSFRPAIGGSYDINSVAVPRNIQGGLGGAAIPQATATTSFNSFRIGGGSGAGWRSGSEGGGGLVKVYCSGDVTNSAMGTISANGGTPVRLSGGGGGGIVILASRSSVVNAGAINANGGNGGTSFGFGGAGGGGGGGIVLFVAPTVSNTGTVSVAGGTGGSTATQVSNPTRYGGGGGGASGGTGGNGSDISALATVTASPPSTGSVGYVLSILANPAYLMQ